MVMTIDDAIEYIRYLYSTRSDWSELELLGLKGVVGVLKRCKEIVNEPETIKKLYAIQNVATGEIIFNARGGAYKKPEEAMAKLDKLEDGKYRLVTYELKEG